jgi:hypothetical protein
MDSDNDIYIKNDDGSKGKKYDSIVDGKMKKETIVIKV